MLIRFVSENYRSIGEELVFDMLPAPSKKVFPHHVYSDSRIRLLRTGAIYGANGAGKSNVLKAINTLRSLAIGEMEVPSSTEYMEYRLGAGLNESPVRFEVEFVFKSFYLAYAVAFKNGIILDESLYELGFEKDDILVYNRKTDAESLVTSIEVGDKFFSGKEDKLLVKILKNNIVSAEKTLLSKADVVKKEIVSVAKEWLEDYLLVVFPTSHYLPLVKTLRDEKFKHFANDILKSYNTGIEQLDVVEIPLDEYDISEKDKERIRSGLRKNPQAAAVFRGDGTTVTIQDGLEVVLKPQSYHLNSEAQNVQFDIEDESRGSRRLIDFLPIFDSILNSDATVFIDEIESSIHPSLLKAIVKKLLEVDTPLRGQIVFTTHECNLLDLKLFRQDEIWFTEKVDGYTTLYPLTDFDPRQDLDIEKGYINGRFGAVPFLGNLEDLNWGKPYDKKEKALS